METAIAEMTYTIAQWSYEKLQCYKYVYIAITILNAHNITCKTIYIQSLS